ncbi:MAG: hypothetical protein ACSHYA_14885 [Opitutaceae bacterium]
MLQKHIAYCLILMMAMNGLLASAGGAMLCLHDHNFGHLLAGQHASGTDACHGAADACHGDESETHQQASHDCEADGALFSTSDQHCFDILISSSNEPVQRVADLTTIKKIVAANYQYQLFAPTLRVKAAPQIRLATRAPPDLCDALEQCVRKTVLRI